MKFLDPQLADMWVVGTQAGEAPELLGRSHVWWQDRRNPTAPLWQMDVTLTIDIGTGRMHLVSSMITELTVSNV